MSRARLAALLPPGSAGCPSSSAAVAATRPGREEPPVPLTRTADASGRATATATAGFAAAAAAAAATAAALRSFRMPRITSSRCCGVEPFLRAPVRQSLRPLLAMEKRGSQ
eukprot:CAMPEP_0185360534 /NCGR_PEP_ID=MMETSP1364-20130426/9665_1 /TAXON_ID=38817 /ORGANISM="Gephyrocapsa oceanica, Strain RCC1303" /LENGTH=110 /DNA_ID=CAMNT_0027960797 /DNA_START=190 /DNA_END=519 /DNA_ORIENTATION=+